MSLKDLFKELLAICILTPLLYNFCSAENVEELDLSINNNGNSQVLMFSSSTTNYSIFPAYSSYFVCFPNDIYASSSNISNINNNFYTVFSCSSSHTNSSFKSSDFYGFNDCTFLYTGSFISSQQISYPHCYKNTSSAYFYYTIENIPNGNFNGNSAKVYGNYNNIENFCSSINTCEDMTSLECQTEYNLIPISDVTKNYCELNFDLIDPVNCPSSGGTGDIVRSNVYINNILYPGSSDVYLNVNERLAFDISYNTGFMYVDVYGYEADEDYINGIIEVNSYRPTSEDFTSIFVGGLVRLFPFIVIALFIAFVRKLIRKIFK